MMSLTRLTVNNIDRPLGLDEQKPLFGWSFDGTEARGVMQTAYRILVFDDPGGLTGLSGIVWDSGIVTSSRNMAVVYEGERLVPRTRYYWEVQVWTSDGASSSCKAASWWETGLMDEEWNDASWIGVDPRELERWQPAPGYANAKTLPLLRRAFSIRQGLVRARAYASGLGFYELRFNGFKAGDSVLEPGWTNPGRSVLYSSYDITGMLREGDNAAGVMLGNGFYNVNEEPGRYMKHCVQRDFSPKRVLQGDPRAIVKIALDYEDGETEWIVTDGSWQVAPGPIVYSCIYGGEDYDARKEIAGWDTPWLANAADWSQVVVLPSPGGVLRAQTNPPNAVMGELQPASWTEPKPCVYVADMGQNFSGWFRLKLSGAKAGQRIFVTPAELLDGAGAVRQELEQKEDARNYFVYTAKDGDQTWAPKFTYTGYRYVQIEGAVPAHVANGQDLPVIEELAGEFIYPKVETVGSFECSDSMFNRIHDIIDRAILSNAKSVLTDCPHREKLGWLEEVHLMGPSILYNYDLINLFRKLVNDMAEAQLPNGLIPDIAPEYAIFEDGFLDSPEWGGAFILVPWYLYHWQGDVDLLAQHYYAMRRYADYLGTQADDGILSHGLGDWADVGPNPPFAQNTPVPITATCYYFKILMIMAAVAEKLGNASDAARFETEAIAVNRAFHERFYDAATANYGSGSQTSNAAPVALGLTPHELIPSVVANICRDIEARGFHTTSGDVGHRLVLSALADNGKSAQIARMLQQTDDPSYGYQILHGATALTEHWDGPTSGKSQNHFMLGHAEEWFYRHLVGIVRPYDREPEDGVDVEIRPFPADGIEWAKASHRLPQGEIAVAWKRKADGSFNLRAKVPVNVTARIYVPVSEASSLVSESGVPVEKAPHIALLGAIDGYAVYKVGSGIYEFQS